MVQDSGQNCVMGHIVMAVRVVLVVRYYQSDLRRRMAWARNVAHMGKMGKVLQHAWERWGKYCSTHGKDGESTVASMGKMGKVPNILVSLSGKFGNVGVD
jgi:hypothetical protein